MKNTFKRDTFRKNAGRYWKLRQEFAELISEISPFESKELQDPHWIEYDKKNTNQTRLLKQLIRKVDSIVGGTIQPTLEQTKTYTGDKSLSKVTHILQKLPDINTFLEKIGLEKIELQENTIHALQGLKQAINNIQIGKT